MPGNPQIQKSPREGNQLKSIVDLLEENGLSASSDQSVIDSLLKSDEAKNTTDATGISSLGVESSTLNEDIINVLVRQFVTNIGVSSYQGMDSLDYTQDEFGSSYYRMSNNLNNYNMNQAKNNNSYLINRMKQVEDLTYYRMNNVYPPLSQEERNRINSDLEAMRVCRSYLSENNTLMDYDMYGTKKRVNNRISRTCSKTSSILNSQKSIYSGSLNNVMNTVLYRQISPNLSTTSNKEIDPVSRILNGLGEQPIEVGNNPYLSQYGESINSLPDKNILMQTIQAKIKAKQSNYDYESSSNKDGFPFDTTILEDYIDLDPEVDFPSQPSRNLPPYAKSRNSMYYRRQPSMSYGRNLPSSNCPSSVMDKLKLFDITSMLSNIKSLMSGRMNFNFSNLGDMLNFSQLDIQNIITSAINNPAISDSIDCSCNCSQQSTAQLRQDLYDTGRSDFNDIIDNLDDLNSQTPTVCNNTKNYRSSSYNSMLSSLMREFGLVNSNVMNGSMYQSNSLINSLLSRLLGDSNTLFGSNSMFNSNCLNMDFDY